MSDGVLLSALLYLPSADALKSGQRYPFVFDYYPYRKDDSSAGRRRMHWTFARRGFVAARIDVRGSGSSGGTALDEYVLQEQLDAVEAIAWVAAQPWSNGNVGMFGSSYGGFNALQVAMHRPPALKAICPMYFTDNRYTDDCHYRGGSMQMLYDIGTYGLSMVAMNALPPVPEAVGEDWAATWDDHLRAEPWFLTWLEHQTNDDYWKHGSLCEDYAAIECATYLFGGWRDGYVSCNLRTFEHLPGPKKLIVGPWGHTWPDAGVPGPRIDHIHEHVRFFEHWLAGADNGVMDEPPITIYVQRFDPPKGRRTFTTGDWRHEPGWPLDRSFERRLHLADDGRLTGDAPLGSGLRSYRYNPTVGTTFGIFGGSSALPLMPADQRLEDAHSLNWTSLPLSEELEILGRPSVALRVSASAEVATVVARLIDVAPDGAAALVTKGALNLTRRHSMERPEPLTPGEPVDVRFELDATSWVFEPGHAIRVAITGADYPLLWPSPEPYVGEVHWGASSLVLPALRPQEPRLPAPALQPPAAFTELPSFQPARATWRVTHDHMAGTVEVHVATSGVVRLDERHAAMSRGEATTVVAEDDPARATVSGVSELTLEWPEQTISARARGQITSDAEAFHATAILDVTIDGTPFHSARWSRSFPRRLL